MERNMKTYQEKAEAYVRQQLPELMELSFGCEILVNLSQGGGEKAVLVGKTPHLVHWSWAKHHDNKSSFVGSELDDRIVIIGHPIQLQHWLNCLHPKIGPDAKIEAWIGNRIKIWTGKTKILFNLTTGQPATEQDYQAFCEIVGINQD